MSDHFIQPLMIRLNKKIETDVYFLKLPELLKEKLMHLEENSKKNFIKEKHNLPLNTLKKLFITYLPGVSDMKYVSNKTEDIRWLIACQPININIAIKIIKTWIEAFYIEETELEKSRNNTKQVKEYAKQIIDEISEEMFMGCQTMEHIVLFENGMVTDKDAYSLLPLIMVNKMIGSDVIIHGKKSHWVYSDKNEIITEPLDFTSSKGKDYFSYVVHFEVQTIPPYNESHLNVDITTRRWISSNQEEIIPYLSEKKSVYIRINENKLQVMQVMYTSGLIDWIYTDKKCYQLIYGEKNLHDFTKIIVSPEKYMIRLNYFDAYIPFEYGMTGYQYEGKITHDQDAGKSFQDCQDIFTNIISKIDNDSDDFIIMAKKVAGNENSKVYFEDDFTLKSGKKGKNNIGQRFKENINLIAGDKKIRFEIWSTGGQEEIRNELHKYIESHIQGTNAEILCYDLLQLGEVLECENENAKSNIMGYNKRISEILQVVEKTEVPTIAIVVLHNEKYYRLNGKMSGKVDPKKAIRVGFALTGRLTQFITPENYIIKKKDIDRHIEKGINLNKTHKCNMVIRNTILDAYRQIGINNVISMRSKLNDKFISGIYVCNYKNVINGTRIEPFPIIISCDMDNHKIYAETELTIVDVKSYQREESIKIACPYHEFPIKFVKLIYNMPRGKALKCDQTFIESWFTSLNKSKLNEIMIAADGTSRKIIEGISNAEIERKINRETYNIEELMINSKEQKKVDLKKMDTVNFIRIRVNGEVPDYIPEKKDNKFVNTSGIYSYKQIYYSQDVRPFSENNNFDEDTTKIDNDKAFTHRNLIEIYPMHCCSLSTAEECAADIHNLRKASIQYEAGKTILPMPLHLAKKLEEYII